MQTRYKSIFAGRRAPLEGRANVGRRSGGTLAAFSHGKHGKLEKGGSERGERTARRARNGDEAIFSECGRAPPAGNTSATGRHRSARPSRALSTRALGPRAANSILINFQPPVSCFGVVFATDHHRNR